jgi:drug/metabolite transporter (DMT)-like permease
MRLDYRNGIKSDPHLKGSQGTMLQNWYALSIISLFFMGTQRFLYKVSAQRGCNTAWTTFTFMGTVTVLSSISFLISCEPVPGIFFLVLISLVNSVSFTLGTLSHMEALKYLPASVAYPIIRLNAAVVVVFSVFFFRDHLSQYQIVGIFIAIAVISILARESNSQEATRRDIRRGFSLVAVCVLSGAVASISSKFAAMYTDKMAFIALSYFMGTLFSFAFRNRLVVETAGGRNTDAVIIGIAMGLLNFAGFYAFLSALAIGPLSIIISIMGLHFVIPIILSTIIYSEKLTPIRIFGVLLTIVSVIFLRYGESDTFLK